MNDKFILDESGKVVPASDLEAWALWFESSGNKRVVAKTQVGDSQVSTVFLALDHGFGAPEPVLWETMVFGGRLNQAMARCSGNREQAEAMHAEMVRKVGDT